MAEPIKVTLTDPSGDVRSLSFLSLQDLKDWVQNEQKFLGKLGDLQGALRTVQSHLNSISNLITNAESRPQDALTAPSVLLRQVNSNYLNYLNYSPYIDSAHPLADWLASQVNISNKGPSAALDLLSNRTPNYLAGSEKSGVDYSVGRLVAKGATEHSKSAMAQVKRGVTRIEKKLEQLEDDRTIIRAIADKDMDEIRSNFETALRALDGRATTIQREIALSSLSRARRMLRRARKSRQKLDETNRAYRDDLSLEPAVEYWTEQETHHQENANSLKNWMLGAVAVAFVVLISVSVWVASSEPFSGELGDPNVVFVSVALVALLTILFWVGRVLARQYLGHVHLRNDARERATVVQSFLALNIEGVATEKDRAVMLTTVFRPSTDGVVKDDAAPALGLAALLSGPLSKS